MFPKIPTDFYSKSYVKMKQDALSEDELFTTEWDKCSDAEKAFLAEYLVHFSVSKAVKSLGQFTRESCSLQLGAERRTS